MAVDAPVVVLAAGQGSRVGMPKGLVTVGGKPWLALQLTALATCGVRDVAVVLGHDVEEHQNAMALLGATGLRVRTVLNARPELGPFSSLQAGLAMLPPGSAAYILPVDVPCPRPEVWGALAEALARCAGDPKLANECDAAVPVHGGRGGHPVLCSDRFLARLRGLSPADPDARLDAQLRAAAVARVPVDDARVRIDLNTPEDWATIDVDYDTQS
jgi:nicotine blue oxidoreductase